MPASHQSCAVLGQTNILPHARFRRRWRRSNKPSVTTTRGSSPQFLRFLRNRSMWSWSLATTKAKATGKSLSGSVARSKVAAQVQFVHAESAAEMLQNPSDARTCRVAWFDRGARRRRTRWRDRARTQRQSWVHPCPCLRPFLLRAGNLIHEDASPDFQAQNELLMPPSLAEITEESPFPCSRRDALRQHSRRLIGACRWKCSNSSQGSNLTICETDTFGIVPKSAVGHGVRTRRFAAQGEHQSALFCQAFLGGGPHVGSSGHY